MLKRLKTEVDKLQNENLTELFKGLDVTGIQQAEQKVEQLQNNLKELIAKTNLSELTKEFGSFGATIDGTFAKMSKSNSVQKFKEAFKSGDIKQMDVALTGLEAHLERYYKTKDGGKKSGYDSFENDITTLRKLKEELTKIPGANQLEIELREARQELERLTAENTQALENGLRESASGANMTAEGMERVTRETRDAASAAHGLTSEVDMLKSQVSYFFGLTNAVMLFRRALTEAFETVKELDAVMTEMSVVTDLNVGDYWDQLPEYSKRAKELGVSIKDAYSAATLYYQQGLKTNEVVAVSSETLKMARIAGMEAKEATDMMTAALRGFNMEINETSAQRINDVYSELAAVTASDTEEIATAMTKTASIAASANMEFETTSALLAQIIETTREAPETAGTAMKTIIARFTEVKELFSEGQLTGTDEEGEAININKIDAALKSVGMSLSGFLQGTQGIDDIFLELASKWDTLDIATQRYIATMAAGSRQQSRFLAMMSDYDRTMELVEAANSSAGASQAQFNKTLDSLETKLNKLSVAWDTFLMGIANNDLIKFGVDTLTGLLNTINKIIDTISGGSGILKSFFSIGTVTAGLALGKAAFDGIFKHIGAQLAAGASKEGTKAGKIFGMSFSASSKKTMQVGSIKTYGTIFDNKALLAAKIGVQEQTAAGQAYYKTLLKVAGAQTLSNEQQRISNILTSNGLDEDMAKLGAVSGLTEAEIANAVATAQSNFTDEMSEEQKKDKIRVTLQEIAATKGSAWAEKEYANATKGGIVAKLKAIGVLLFGSQKKKADAILTLGLATAEEKEAVAAGKEFVAHSKLNKILMTPHLGLYVLAIAAAVAAIALLAKKIETAAEKEKRLNKQLETSSEALSEVKNNLQEVEDAFNGLNDQAKTLEGLTEGTSEWNAALIETNNQVLELLQKYPELAQYIESANGVLSISSEGQKEYLELLNEQLAKQQILNSGANIQKTIHDLETKELNILTEGTSDLSIISFKQQIASVYEEIGEEALKATQESTADFIKANYDNNFDEIKKVAFNNDELNDLGLYTGFRQKSKEEVLDNENLPKTFTKYSDEIYRLAEETGKTAEEVYQAYVEFGLLNNQLEAANETVQGFITSLLTANASEDITNDKQYGQDVIELFNNMSAEEYDQKFEEARAEVTGTKGSLRQQYEDLTGLEASDEWDKEYLKDQIANFKVMEPILDNMEKFYDIFQELNEDGQKQLIGAIKEDGKGFTKTMIESYGKDGDSAASLQEIMESTGLTEVGLAGVAATLGLVDEDGNGDINQLVDYVNQNLEFATANIDKVFERFGEFAQGSIGNIGAGQDLSYGALSGVADQLYNVMLTSGSTAANNMASAINSAMEGLSQEDAEAFASTLANIDWSSTESVEGLSEQLKGLEVAIDETQVEELEKQIIDFADAADNLTFEEAKADMKELKELSEAMADQEGYVFTEELKDQLIEAGKADADDFVMTGIDEWVYIGGSMEELLRSIEGDTGAILGELAGSLETRIEKGEKWEGLTDIGVTIGDATYTDTTKAVEDILNGVTAATKDEMLGILAAAGVVLNNTDIMSDQQVKDVLEKEYSNYGFGGLTHERNLAEQKSVTASRVAQDRFLWDEVNDIYSEQNSEQYVQGLEAQMRALGATEEEVADLTDSYIDNGKVLKKDTIIQAQNTVEQKRAEKATADNVKAVSELVGEYEKIAEMPQDIKIKVANEIGLDDVNLTSDQKITFIEDNFNLIQQYAQGSYDAMVQLESKYRTYVESMFGELKAFAKDGITFTVDAEGYLNMQPVIDEIIRARGITDEMQAKLDLFFDSAYYEIEYEYVPRVNPEALAGGISGLADDIDAGGVEYIKIPKIKRKGRQSFNEGINRSGVKKGGGGGGKNEATNDYDRHYNLVQDINAELRTREKLERQYDKLLDDRYADGQDYYELTMKQLESLERQKKLQEQLVAARKEDFKRTISENSKYSKYAWYNASDNTLEIDWGKLDVLAKSNPDEYEKVSDYISQLEEDFDDIKDAEDELEDISDEVKEIKERGKEDYSNLLDRVVDALISQEQELIDEQEKISEAIDEAASDLMDAIQSNIDKFRQDRDNKKTEESIAEKERRLAYLRQDTSGANAMEIKKLEEELSDEKESYGDTLIDQAMENLQEQNDAAAEQRERQIELQQSQLDWAEKTGKFNEEANRLMREGIVNGHISQDSELYQLLADAEGVEFMNDMSKEEWIDGISQAVYKAYEWSMKMDDTDYMAEMIKLFEENGGIVDSEILQLNALRNQKIDITGKGDKINDENLGSYLRGRTATDYMAEMIQEYARTGKINSRIRELNTARNKKIQETGKGTAYTNETDLENYLKSRTGTNSGGGSNINTTTNDNPPTEPAKPTTSATREYTIKSGDSLTKIAKNELGNMSRWKEIADLNGLKKPYTIYAGKKLKLPAYKTGGLANFTGPAWLDGTKSKPELVLNARDTENFILLKDVLSSLLHLPKNNQNSAPNSNYFDIDVKVDEIGNDYDVDRMIDRVKEKIYEDSMYRNVNSLNLLR